MVECDFHANCLGHFRYDRMAGLVVYVHLLPSYPVLDVFLLLNSRWVQVAGGKFDFCSDYDWYLWWRFDSSPLKCDG